MSQETDSMRKEKFFFYTKTLVNTRKLSFTKMAESKFQVWKHDWGGSVTLQWQASWAGLYTYRRELRQKSSHSRLFLQWPFSPLLQLLSLKSNENLILPSRLPFIVPTAPNLDCNINILTASYFVFITICYFLCKLFRFSYTEQFFLTSCLLYNSRLISLNR